MKYVGNGNFREALLMRGNQTNTENKVTLGDVAVKRKKLKGEIKN